MSDNELLNEEFDEDDVDYITLVNDDGEEVSFELIDEVEYKEHRYAVLIPFDEEDDGVVILEMLPVEDDEDTFDFIGVEDEKLLEEIFEYFKKNYKGEYEFE